MKVSIIGGGVIGMSIAYHLADHCQVVVYEKDRSYQQSSFARSCGGLRHQYSTKTNVLMSQYSIDFIKNKTNVPFTPNGYLMLFGHDKRLDHDQSIELYKSLGTPTTSLTVEELAVRYPFLNLDDVYRGCVTLDGSEGWIDPVTLHQWYRDQAREKGVTTVYDDGLTCNVDGDCFVVASGCWTGEVLKRFGIECPVKGHKHTVYNVQTEKLQIPNLPLVADLVTGIYLRPEGHDYIVGYDGNGEWNSDNLDPDYSSWDKVWGLLYHRFPNHFDACKMVGAWAGYYDTSTIDRNAIIDRKDNVFFATGFTGRGLMHSPAVGLVVSDMILNRSPTFDISSYKLNREPEEEKYVL
jgi:glycine/D-amino acid oxidase-like deaminating enzyme